MRFAGFRKKFGFAWAGDSFGCNWESRLACRNSRPMPAVAPGVSELRVKGEDGIFRDFYYTASSLGVLVFHAFIKKTQRTPPLEMELARKRLKELLDA
jgi:phage-related protein